MVSQDFAGASLARRLVLEGHEVKAFVRDPASAAILRGLVPRVASPDDGLSWCGRDAADFLALCDGLCGRNGCESCGPVLQEKVEGEEVVVARYFNGRDWVGPIEVSIEHKRMFPGGMGPNTFEMGSLALV